MLVNFQPVLIPPPTNQNTESEVDDYFKAMCDTDTDYYADSEVVMRVNKRFYHDIIIILLQ